MLCRERKELKEAIFFACCSFCVFTSLRMMPICVKRKPKRRNDMKARIIEKIFSLLVIGYMFPLMEVNMNVPK